MCGSLTSVVPAKRTRRCIRTSSLASTVHRRSFSEATMVLESTCGVSDASLLSCSLGIPSSLVRMSRNNSRVSWKFSVHLLGISSKRPPGESFSSIRHSSLASQYQAKAGGDVLAVRLLAVPSSVMMKPSWTSSLNVFVGILRSVCDQIRPCPIPSLPTSPSEKQDLSVLAQGMQLQWLRQSRPRHRSLLSSGYTQQTRPSRRFHCKQRQRLLARVPCRTLQTQLRIMHSQQPLISTTS
jgi:hypothetical protein